MPHSVVRMQIAKFKPSPMESEEREVPARSGLGALLVSWLVAFTVPLGLSTSIPG